MALVALEGTDQLRVMARCQPCGRLVSHSPPAPPLFCPSCQVCRHPAWFPTPGGDGETGGLDTQGREILLLNG